MHYFLKFYRAYSDIGLVKLAVVNYNSHQMLVKLSAIKFTMVGYN